MNHFTSFLADGLVTELKINWKLAVKCNWLCVCSIEQLANVKIWNVSVNDEKWQGATVDRFEMNHFLEAVVNVTEFLFLFHSKDTKKWQVILCPSVNVTFKSARLFTSPSSTLSGARCGSPTLKRVTASVHGADPGVVWRSQLHLLSLILIEGQASCCLF